MPPPTQVWPESTPSYDSSDFQDLDMNMGCDPLISSTFIEAVSNSMGFSDKDYCSSLHSIPKVSCATSHANLITNTQSDGAPELQRGHLQLAVYQTGLMYAILKESHTITDLCCADRAIMADPTLALRIHLHSRQNKKYVMLFIPSLHT